MGRLGRDVYRRKLERYLSHSFDEPIISLISALVAAQSGSQNALAMMQDLPPEALGAELGSPYHIPLWSVETLVNELLAIPKAKGFGTGRTRVLNAEMFQTLRALQGILIKLENAEDGMFLEKHDVFYEMARIAQRQFPWQRGVTNAPHLYRSMLLYGTGSAREYFEASAGISLSDFVKTGACMSGALAGNAWVHRQRSLSEIGISPEVREATLRKLAIPHVEARHLAARMRKGHRHTAYRPSILRDFPIIAFGEQDERLRAPMPELIMYRYTSGLYLDVVEGGSAVWTDIGARFEGYVLEYLQTMMSPYEVIGEQVYGPKKARHRTPDVLVSGTDGIVAVIECKSKRMSFDARYADDPVTSASVGFDELAKGMFQIWRFISHARRGLTGDIKVDPFCRGAIVTADSWLTMASRQAEQVIATAMAMADAEGNIDEGDRREIAFCPIDDVEYVLQHGTADSFLDACREVSSGEKKGFMLSVAHAATRERQRGYPFKDRIADVLPWMRSAFEHD
ncbi:hypothetical protein [Novosphingobium sp. CECT 9465]|uniref:hypothetical protein n=1 Tax=Novosphingobium sp. CECT 9465 TaxID=2829794 RepID=UPI001E638663|nr:hypothetical protein [Novosphingobium sp. CECT 9465]CAH0496024.1 hypothetical protein NVSP9465_01050 [Novosphingobium sp. CECT 9465]